MAGFVYGVLGFYLIRIGKNSANVWHVFCGAILIIYPYFISGAFLNWGIGAVVLLIAYLKR